MGSYELSPAYLSNQLYAVHIAESFTITNHPGRTPSQLTLVRFSWFFNYNSNRLAHDTCLSRDNSGMGAAARL